MLNESFILKKKYKYKIKRFSNILFTSVLSANCLSWRNERIFCVALTMSLSNPVSIGDDCWSRKMGFGWRIKDGDDGLYK